MWLVLLIMIKLGEAFLSPNIYSLPSFSHLESTHSVREKETMEPDFQVLLSTLLEVTGSSEVSNDILTRLHKLGFSSTEEVLSICQDFKARPEAMHKIFHSDFSLCLLDSHKLRASVMLLLNMKASSEEKDTNRKDEQATAIPMSIKKTGKQEMQNLPIGFPSEEPSFKKFKEFIVDEKRQILNKHDSGIAITKKYGLVKNSPMPPLLKKELNEFLLYMTEPAVNAQEAPIRKTTADVYLRHARLFCGWWLSTQTQLRTREELEESSIGLKNIFPSADKAAAAVLYDFFSFLRKERKISSNYEANFIRGLNKLSKFRFRAESKSDPSYGEKPFEDIGVVREVRKLHREANKNAKLAPKVSNESRKWLDWPEYLGVVRAVKAQLRTRLISYREDFKNCDQLTISEQKKKLRDGRRVASVYQQYLLLAFFAVVPDRQRTFRELQLGTTLVREKIYGVGEEYAYVIKHGPEDYKTGKSYGPRPPLQLARSLTSDIDTFIKDWRHFLKPQSDHLFVQLRTGKAWTADTIYSLVARACFEHTGKKTNPHLLRDMVVTYVRSGDASEKELEALALYMGHSIGMQRESYDRRTLQQKVSPAVHLLQEISSLE